MASLCEFGEPMQNYILAVTEDSDRQSDPEHVMKTLQRSHKLDQVGAEHCALFLAERLAYAAVPVKIKTLSLLSQLGAEGGPLVMCALQLRTLPSVQATCSFSCDPDPTYGDKPMQMVQNNAAQVTKLLGGLNAKKLQKAGEKALASQDKARQRGIEDPDEYDMGPVIETGRFKGDPMGAQTAYDLRGSFKDTKWQPQTEQLGPAELAELYGGGRSPRQPEYAADPVADEVEEDAAESEAQLQTGELGLPPKQVAPTRGAGGGFSDTCADWILGCTSPDEQSAPAETLELLTEALNQCDPQDLPQVVQHIGSRLESHAVQVVLKALVLAECLLRNVSGADFNDACLAHLAAPVGATKSYVCDPDPTYGDKPMNFVRSKATTVHEMITNPEAFAAAAAAAADITPPGTPTKSDKGETALATFKVCVPAPYFKKWQKDSKVRGTLQENTLIEVFETRLDKTTMKNKARHALGWTPTHAPDGSVVLEQLIIESPKARWKSAAMKMKAVRNLGPTASFETLVEFTPSLLEEPLEGARSQLEASAMIRNQCCKMLSVALDKILGSLGEDEDLKMTEDLLEKKIEEAMKVFRPQLKANTPPDPSEILYEVLSALRSKPEHSANELAEQALQAGVPLIKLANESATECFEALAPACEKVAYGSTLPEPHKAKAQAACRVAKGFAEDKNFAAASDGLQKLAEKLLDEYSTGEYPSNLPLIGGCGLVVTDCFALWVDLADCL